MAVVWVKEISKGRGERDYVTNERNYTRNWLAFTDNAHTDSTDVLAHASIPQKGQHYVTSTGEDTAAFVEKVKAERRGLFPYIWEVEAEYSTDTPDEFYERNPLKRPPELNWGRVTLREVVQADKDNEPVVNKAGFPIVPGLEIERHLPVLTVTKNTQNALLFNEVNLQEDECVTNLLPFMGWDIDTAKLTPVTGDWKFENNVGFFTVQYRIEFNKKTWFARVLNQGFTEKKAAGGFGVTVANEGFGVNEPRLLDDDGKFLSPGLPPVFLEFRVFEQRDFDRLNILKLDGEP